MTTLSKFKSTSARHSNRSRDVIVGLVGLNGEIMKDYKDQATQYDQEAYDYWHDDQGTQTHISLANTKYDVLFSSNINLDKMFNASKFGSLHKLGGSANINTSINMGSSVQMSQVVKESKFTSKDLKNFLLYGDGDIANFGDEEYNDILEYIGLKGEDGENLMNKEELYNYLHGNGGGVFKQLKQFFRIQSMQYINDEEIAMSVDNRKYRSLGKHEDLDVDIHEFDKQLQQQSSQKYISDHGEGTSSISVDMDDSPTSGLVKTQPQTKRKTFKKSGFSKATQLQPNSSKKAKKVDLLTFSGMANIKKNSKTGESGEDAHVIIPKAVDLNTSIQPDIFSTGGKNVFELKNGPSMIAHDTELTILEATNEMNNQTTKISSTNRFKTAAFTSKPIPHDLNAVQNQILEEVEPQVSPQPPRRISILYQQQNQQNVNTGQQMLSFGSGPQNTNIPLSQSPTYKNSKLVEEFSSPIDKNKKHIETSSPNFKKVEIGFNIQSSNQTTDRNNISNSENIFGSSKLNQVQASQGNNSSKMKNSQTMTHDNEHDSSIMSEDLQNETALNQSRMQGRFSVSVKNNC